MSSNKNEILFSNKEYDNLSVQIKKYVRKNPDNKVLDITKTTQKKLNESILLLEKDLKYIQQK